MRILILINFFAISGDAITVISVNNAFVVCRMVQANTAFSRMPGNDSANKHSGSDEKVNSPDL